MGHIKNLVRDFIVLGIRRDRVIVALITIYLMFNLFDLFSTLFMVGIGVAREMNPLMRFFLERSVPLAILVKFFFPGLSAWAFWKGRSHKVMFVLTCIGVLTYAILVGKHVYMMLHLIPYVRLGIQCAYT